MTIKDEISKRSDERLTMMGPQVARSYCERPCLLKGRLPSESCVAIKVCCPAPSSAWAGQTCLLRLSGLTYGRETFAFIPSARGWAHSA